MLITITKTFEVEMSELVDINSIKDNIVDMIDDQIDYDTYKAIIEYSPDSYNELIRNTMLYVAKKIIEEYEES